VQSVLLLSALVVEIARVFLRLSTGLLELLELSEVSALEDLLSQYLLLLGRHLLPLRVSSTYLLDGMLLLWLALPMLT
jgi:hypothetical protein